MRAWCALADVRGVLVARQERRERLGRGRVRGGARHRVGEPDIGRQGLHRARRQVSAHGPPPGRRRRLGVLIGYAAKRSGIGKAEPFPQVRVGDPTSLPVPAGRRGEQHAHGAAAGVEGQGAASAPVVYADVGERAPGAHHLSRRRAERGGFEAVAAEMRAQGYVGVVTGLLGGHVRAGGEHLRREPVGETFGASGVAERRLAGDEQAGLVDELLVEDARRPVAPSVAGTPARGEHLPRRAISPALDSALIGPDGRYHLAGLGIPVVGPAVRDEAPVARDRVEGLGELAVGEAPVEAGGPGFQRMPLAATGLQVLAARANLHDAELGHYPQGVALAGGAAAQGAAAHALVVAARAARAKVPVARGAPDARAHGHDSAVRRIGDAPAAGVVGELEAEDEPGRQVVVGGDIRAGAAPRGRRLFDLVRRWRFAFCHGQGPFSVSGAFGADLKPLSGNRARS